MGVYSGVYREITKRKINYNQYIVFKMCMPPPPPIHQNPNASLPVGIFSVHRRHGAGAIFRFHFSLKHDAPKLTISSMPFVALIFGSYRHCEQSRLEVSIVTRDCRPWFAISRNDSIKSGSSISHSTDCVIRYRLKQSSLCRTDSSPRPGSKYRAQNNRRVL